jgi:pimeloyl-ACP methyl ester carboxylesterase
VSEFSPESEPVRRSVDLADGAMSCLEWPHVAAPTVLFAHANGFNAETYRTLFQPLGESVRILACDLRGHGMSTLPTGASLAKGWTVFRDDLIAALPRIAAAPVLLAGHSLGAVASLMAAAQSGAAVQALLLIEPVLIPPLRKGDEAGAGDLARRAERRRNAFPSFDAAFEAYRSRGIFAAWPEEVVADYLHGGLVDTGDGSLRLACQPEWEAAIFRGAPHDTGPLTEGISGPITIVVGTRNSSTSRQQLDVIRERRPDTRVVTVEGASHFLPMERPEIVREELVRLVQTR